MTIYLPPLRNRTGDLPRLVKHFCGQEWQLDPDVIPTLETYSWPGNIRQLQNAIDRAKILADDDRIQVENLPPEIVKSTQSGPMKVTAGNVDLDTLTRHHVIDTYRRHAGNKASTARALGVGRRTLYRLLEKYGIEENDAG